MQIYKTVFDTEQQGKDILIQKGVWQEVTEEGVTTMHYINGTKGVVNIGKVINPQATTDPEQPSQNTSPNTSSTPAQSRRLWAEHTPAHERHKKSHRPQYQPRGNAHTPRLLAAAHRHHPTRTRPPAT